jgi:hypothetical protein
MISTSPYFKADELKLMPMKDLPDSIAATIQDQVARLRTENRWILDCDVKIEVPAHLKEGCYYIQILLFMNDWDLKIERQPIPDNYQEDIYVAIWNAFDLTRQKLKQHFNGTSDREIERFIPNQSYPINSPLRRRCQGYAGA